MTLRRLRQKKKLKRSQAARSTEKRRNGSVCISAHRNRQFGGSSCEQIRCAYAGHCLGTEEVDREVRKKMRTGARLNSHKQTSRQFEGLSCKKYPACTCLISGGVSGDLKINRKAATGLCTLLGHVTRSSCLYTLARHKRLQTKRPPNTLVFGDVER